MNVINLTFLGQEFTLPCDIISYMDCQQFFSTLRQELLGFMLQRFSDCEKWPSLDLATKKFRGTAEQCVKRLCEQGVYDKTVDDFMENNEGYELYEKDLSNEQKRIQYSKNHFRLYRSPSRIRAAPQCVPCLR